jgi:hypothetical protein
VGLCVCVCVVGGGGGLGGAVTCFLLSKTPMVKHKEVKGIVVMPICMTNSTSTVSESVTAGTFQKYRRDPCSSRYRYSL